MQVMTDHNGEWHFQDPLKDVAIHIDDSLGKPYYSATMLMVTGERYEILFDHNARIVGNDELGIDNDPHYMEDYDGHKWVLLSHGMEPEWWAKHEIAKTPQRRDHG